MSTKRRLDALYLSADKICIGKGSRIVLMSDCHRGVGNHGDNFLYNQNLAAAALSYYDRRQFTYVELGDGDELWENRRIEPIIRMHDDIFETLSRLYRQGRFIMLYGNHDRKKEQPRFMERYYAHYYCEHEDRYRELFPHCAAKEGLILEEAASGGRIFLVHGHQGDLMNDTLWRLTRFLVRHVWRRAELWGMQDPTSAAKNYKRKKKTERRLSAWADENGVLLVAGHTHRPVLPRPGDSLYANDGSCVHPRNITALEIEGGSITLVRWRTEVGKNNALYVGREVMDGPYRIADYFIGEMKR